jgi:hypothetical protein
MKPHLYVANLLPNFSFSQVQGYHPSPLPLASLFLSLPAWLPVAVKK